MALLHALCLIGILLGTLLLVALRFSRPSAKRIVLSFLAVLPPVGLAISLGTHKCYNGEPVDQWLVPAACFVVTGSLNPTGWMRNVWCGFTLAAMLFLSYHYAQIVHGPELIGTPHLAPATLAEEGFTRIEATWHSPLTGLYLRR